MTADRRTTNATARQLPIAQMVTVTVTSQQGEYGVRGYLREHDETGAILVDTPGHPLRIVTNDSQNRTTEREAGVNSMFIPANNIEIITF